MENWLEERQMAIVAMSTVLIVLAFAYYGLRRKAAQVEARRRIKAARLRSGYVPMEVPTTRASLRGGMVGGDSTMLPDWFTTEGEGDVAAVDETPRMRIRYLDVTGRKTEEVLQVDLLDLEKKLMVCRTHTPGVVRKIFLSQVIAARSAETGQRFNMDTWVEAVRVARRRGG